MKLTAKLTALTLCMGLAGQALATELKHWPADQARQLDAMIAANANKGNFAVFDMDNTSYRYDLEESLLPYMENKGLITRDSLDPSLKLMPFKDTAEHKESLFSYYYRLCEVDDMVCYPWVAQVFSGFTLKELKVQNKKLETEQDEIEDNLKLFFGDAESIVDGNGKMLATWKAPKASEKFDTKAFQADHPKACAKYIKQVQGARRLLIK